MKNPIFFHIETDESFILVGATKLNLLRYGTLSTIYKAINAYNPKNLTKDLRDKSTHRMRYMELIQNTNIVFCHPTDMYNLKSR